MLFVTESVVGVRYYWTGVKECDSCGADLFPIAFHIREWRGLEHKDTVLCERCLEHIPEPLPSTPLQERRSVIISDFAPKRSIAVLPRKPSLVNGGLSVFDAASDKKASAVEVEDKTLLAGREKSYFLSAAEREREALAYCASKDRPLNDEEAFKMLEGDDSAE